MNEHRIDSIKRRLTLPGVLAVLAGVGLVVAYTMFPVLIRAWRGFSGIVFVTLAIALVLWGTSNLARNLFPKLGRSYLKRSRRQRVIITREGIVYLTMMIIFFVGALMGRSNMLLLVFALMAGPFILNGWITFSMLKRAHVERRVPKRIMAGEPFSVDLVLSNGRWWLSAWLVRVQDRLESVREQFEVGVLFSCVPPHSRRTGRYRVRLTQRGCYTFPSLSLSSRFPLGLIARSRIFELKDEILVYPRIGRLTSNWKREFLRAQELVQPRALRRGAMQDEFHRLREHRWGDNPRSIHWRTSARRNQLIVCEYRQSRDRHLLLLLDLWLPKRPSPDDHERVEGALKFAATICLEHLRHSHDADLAILGNGKNLWRWRGRAGHASIESVLDILAVVEGGRSHNIRQLFDDPLTQSAANMQHLLVTTRTRPSLETANVRDLFASHHMADPSSVVHVVEADPQKLAALIHVD